MTVRQVHNNHHRRDSRRRHLAVHFTRTTSAVNDRALVIEFAEEDTTPDWLTDLADALDQWAAGEAPLRTPVIPRVTTTVRMELDPGPSWNEGQMLPTRIVVRNEGVGSASSLVPVDITGWRRKPASSLRTQTVESGDALPSWLQALVTDAQRHAATPSFGSGLSV